MLTLATFLALTAVGDSRYLLTDSASNVHCTSFELDHTHFPARQTGPWSIRLITLHGGKQEGSQLVVIDSGAIAVRVIPTRGMGILDVTAGDLRVGWESPVKEVVHPQFIRLESRGGLGWLDGFNEWMVRCGLESAGQSGKDEFINNTGGKAEMDLTLHGKIANIPASRVEVIIDEQPPHRLRVRGIVYERAFYGPKLELATELSIAPGETTFRLADTVTNRGAASQEYQLIYHANYGAPLLEAGAMAIGPMKKVAPRNEHAAKSIDQFASYQGPTTGFVEQVYLCEPMANAAGQTIIALKNRRGDRAASIRWSVAELPYLTIWKNTAATADGYVTGLEPSTGFPYHRKVERKFGRVPQLAPGESKSFTLEFGLHQGANQVEQLVDEINKISTGKRPEVQRQPPFAE